MVDIHNNKRRLLEELLKIVEYSDNVLVAILILNSIFFTSLTRAHMRIHTRTHAGVTSDTGYSQSL